MRKQNGITLVALIITIIVLLILAGVSISLVVGNNGVLNQASSAVIANKEAQAKEEVAMAWSSAITKYWSDWANNATVNKNDYLSKSVLDPYLENGSLVEDPTLSDGVYTVKYQTGGAVYTFTVDSTGNTLLTGSAEAGVTPSSLVSASQVALVPTTYYGKTVNYSANGVSDWRVFYSNGTNIFLISSNFAEATNIPAGAGMTTESTYRTYWASAPATIDTSNRHDDLFMATNYIINNSTGNNSKCASRLLDTGLWSGYVNPTYADYAIGGPTIEMWIASWNAKYPGDK